ncbi:GlxA family transcriptional regulator [Jatrophihabitans sp. YIM 134969]
MSRRHRVAVLLLPPVVGFDATIPAQMFGSAVDDEGRPLYDVRMVGLDTGPVTSTEGYAIVPQAGPDELTRADTVIVPGTRYPAARRDGVATPELRDAFGRIRPGTRVVSICTGAFALASLGVFDGRRATTHWGYADDFRRLYPRVDLDVDVLFTEDGDLLSSAGVAAGIDVCLHLIRADHGVAVANRAARQCVVPPWREGGQAQFIDRPVPAAAAESTSAAREFALSRLGEPLDVAGLAAVANMSLRTFNRRFREETGRSPGAWIVEQRVAHARHLLEVTDEPVDVVARRAGLGTGASLRQHFRTVVGLSPAAYRRTFRGQPVG